MVLLIFGVLFLVIAAICFSPPAALRADPKVRRRLRIDGFIVLASGGAVLAYGLVQVL